MDPDSGDSFTYTLVTGNGDQDNGSFTIDGNLLKTQASFDFEAKSLYSIRVRTTDSTNQTYEKVLTIQVVDVNEAPTLTLQNAISLLPENANSAGRVKVADIVVVDDALGNETLTLLGPDATMFEILGNELFVRSGVTLDFETRSTFAIDIEWTTRPSAAPLKASSLIH